MPDDLGYPEYRPASMPITPQTARKYQQRAAGLIARWRRECEHDPRSRMPHASAEWAHAFAEWVVTQKPSWVATSWRQVKSSVLHYLRREHRARTDQQAAFQLAIALLEAQTQQGTAKKTTKTSSMKDKRLRDADHAKIRARLLESGSKYAKRLIDFLHAARLTGLRPDEWPTATLDLGPDGSGPVVLIVVNSKNTQGRSHGLTRTLTWPTLDQANISALQECILWAFSADCDDRFEADLKAMQRLLRDICRELWPRRKKKIAQYSCRHEFAAQAKRVYSPAEVAALMGHMSDATATQHYGRMRGSKGKLSAEFPLPTPHQDEVARVRAVLERRRQRLSDLSGGGNDHSM
jgi:hypothetical protein